MALALLVGVVVLVGIYLRANRQARQRWLNQVNLPGPWAFEDGAGKLTFAGTLAQGTFTREDAAGTLLQGHWQVQENVLALISGEIIERYAIRFFQPGVVSLARQDDGALAASPDASGLAEDGDSDTSDVRIVSAAKADGSAVVLTKIAENVVALPTQKQPTPPSPDAPDSD